MSKKREKELTKIIQAARAELEEMRSAKQAKHNLSLIGKCFKYQNSYSMPEGPEDYWWFYVKVISLDGDAVNVLEFQTDKYGEIRIKPEARNVGLSLDYMMEKYEQIDVDEFNAAWQALLDKLQKLEAA